MEALERQMNDSGSIHYGRPKVAVTTVFIITQLVCDKWPLYPMDWLLNRIKFYFHWMWYSQWRRKFLLEWDSIYFWNWISAKEEKNTRKMTLVTHELITISADNRQAYKHPGCLENWILPQEKFEDELIFPWGQLANCTSHMHHFCSFHCVIKACWTLIAICYAWLVSSIPTFQMR